jgi:hypothetical protein
MCGHKAREYRIQTLILTDCHWARVFKQALKAFEENRCEHVLIRLAERLLVQGWSKTRKTPILDSNLGVLSGVYEQRNPQTLSLS